MSQLKSRIHTSGEFKSPEDPVEYTIDSVYVKTGVGIIVAGTLKSGTINMLDELQLGPDKLGKFRTVSVKGIHSKRVAVKEAIAG